MSLNVAIIVLEKYKIFRIFSNGGSTFSIFRTTFNCHNNFITIYIIQVFTTKTYTFFTYKIVVDAVTIVFVVAELVVVEVVDHMMDLVYILLEMALLKLV